MQCNICNSITKVPAQYVNALDSFGNRIDKNERPELSYGSYDLLVSDSFKIRQIQKPIYIFAINVSYIPFANGWFMYLISFLKECIQLLDNTKNAEVVVLTYSDTINYYYVKVLFFILRMVK